MPFEKALKPVPIMIETTSLNSNRYRNRFGQMFLDYRRIVGHQFS